MGNIPAPQDTAEQELLKVEDVSAAFLTLLEALTPLERAVFLLHDVFDHSHAEIAELLHRTEATCRQILRRAKRSLHLRRRPVPSGTEHTRLLDALINAWRENDLEGITSLLAEDVLGHGDGGTNLVISTIIGPHGIARLYHKFASQMFGASARKAVIDGRAAMVLGYPDQIAAIVQIATANGKIQEIEVISDPTRMAEFGVNPNRN